MYIQVPLQNVKETMKYIAEESLSIGEQEDSNNGIRRANLFRGGIRFLGALIGVSNSIACDECPCMRNIRVINAFERI